MYRPRSTDDGSANVLIRLRSRLLVLRQLALWRRRLTVPSSVNSFATRENNEYAGDDKRNGYCWKAMPAALASAYIWGAKLARNVGL